MSFPGNKKKEEIKEGIERKEMRDNRKKEKKNKEKNERWKEENKV